MSGAEIDEFKQNPVMLYLHNRAAQYGDQDSMLPIGKWVDIKIEGSKLVAFPEFDDDDEFALKIQKKVEKGYLNAASVWLDPIAVTDDESVKLQGQPGPTVNKWGVLEASIVDIPNCRGALAIRNSAGKRVLLSGGAAKGSSQQTADVLTYLESLIPNKSTMDKKLLAVKLGLAETATDEQIAEKLATVTNSANQVTQLTTENTGLKAEVVRLKKEAAEKQVADLVDNAITAGKLAAGEREHYVKLATADFETVKTLLEGKQANPSIKEQLSGGANAAHTAELQELLKLSGSDLYEQGKLERLQELDAESFKLKYKEVFGIEYKA
jgi:hypothetical protein